MQGEYWSITTGENPFIPNRFALTVDFSTGNVVGRDKELEEKGVWYVRGGHGYDAQVGH